MQQKNAVQQTQTQSVAQTAHAQIRSKGTGMQITGTSTVRTGTNISSGNISGQGQGKTAGMQM